MNYINVGCDIDGVIDNLGEAIVPYIKQFQREQEKEGRIFEHRVNSIEDITNINLVTFGMSEDYIDEMFAGFEKTGEFFGLALVDGAIDGIKTLSRRGHCVYLITARDHYPGIKDETIRSLYDKSLVRGYDYYEIFCERDKYPIIKEHDIKLMFEDRPETIYELSEKGIYCVCIPQPWNKGVKNNEHIQRIPWNEAVDWVSEVNDKFN